MDNSSKKSLKVLMLPWLAHGHAYPFLELSKRLARQLDYLHIHFCSTPIILDSIRDHLSTVTSPSSPAQPQTRINLVEICLPELPELPPNLHTTKHLPSHLIPTLIQAFAQSEETFSQILESVKPDLLIFDIFQPWAAKLAHKYNIPAVLYMGCTVVASLAAHRYFAPGKEYPFPAISITKDNRRQMKAPAEDEQNNVPRIIVFFVLPWQLSDFVVVRSFRVIESKYIDHLSTLIGKVVVPTGPLIPDISSVSPAGDGPEAEEAVLHSLDPRERRSVVFVSFGSEYLMPYEEMSQLTYGLELSGACFIWIARFPKIEENGYGTNDMHSAKALLDGLVDHKGGLSSHHGPHKGKSWFILI